MKNVAKHKPCDVESFERFLEAMATTMDIPMKEVETFLFQKEDWRARWKAQTRPKVHKPRRPAIHNSPA